MRNYSLPDNAYIEGSQVALKHYREDRVLISGNPSGEEYIALTAHQLCLVFVEIQDAERILREFKQGCCGSPKSSEPAFSLATENDVRQWRGELSP